MIDKDQELMSRSMQLCYIPVTAFSQIEILVGVP